MRLLLIHAFPLDSSMWADQASLDADLITPDLPGFGSDTEAPREMTMAMAAERCIAALGEEPAVVCGLSMGGYVALELWRSRPDLVRGLVFANTRSEADDDEGRAKRLGLADRLDQEGSGFLVEAPPPLLSASAPDELRERVTGIIARQSAGAIAGAARGMASRPDSRPDLAGVSVPTLVITSSDDALIPAAITATMADAVPGAELATIEGAGHLSNMEAPGAFNDLLTAHIRRCS